MQQQEQIIEQQEESNYTSLSDAEKKAEISRVTLRKYLGQLNIKPRSFGIGGRTLYISNEEVELVKRLKHNPSLLEALRREDLPSAG